MSIFNKFLRKKLRTYFTKFLKIDKYTYRIFPVLHTLRICMLCILLFSFNKYRHLSILAKMVYLFLKNSNVVYIVLRMYHD